MLPPFRPLGYVRPSDPDEAARLLVQDPGARILAGGTLVMQGRDASAGTLIDITGAGLDTVTKDGDDWVIGAATPVSALLDHPLPGALLDAARRFGPPAIRAVGTVGGSLLGAGAFGHLAPALLALNARMRTLDADGPAEAPVRSAWSTFPKPRHLLTHLVVPADWAWSGLDQLERTALDHWVCVLALAVPHEGPRRWGVGAATRRPALVEGDDLDDVETFDDHHASADYRRHILSVVARRLRERADG